MHVLITGGAGFIGSHLAEFHLKRGDYVHVVDDLSTGHLKNISPFRDNPRFRFDQQDLLTWPGLDGAVAWADRIYHMAAVVGVKQVLINPVKVMSTNVAGTERLLRAIHHGGWNPQVIITSSSEVYGFNGVQGLEETDDVVIKSGGKLRWTYACAKLADEFLAFSYVRQYDLDIIVVRLFNTIGPRQTGRYGMVVPTFVEQAVNNHPITVYGDGSQVRSFCDVRDTVNALDRLAGAAEAKCKIVNVGNDQEISIRELAEMVRARSGSDSEITYTPYKDAYGEEFEDIQHRRPVLNRLKALTGFTAQHSLEETIDELIVLQREKRQ